MENQIDNDLKLALKSGDKFTLSVLRMLKSEIINESRKGSLHTLTDDEVLKVIKKGVKTRKDSIEEYKKYGKLDTVNELAKEVDILNKYLPQEMSEEEIIKIAVKSMGLDDLKPFDPKEKVIEYLMVDEKKAASEERLVRMRCKDFAYETASESPAPGGGSVSAYMGALGAALGTMVANLSSHKPGWDERWKEFSDWAEKGQEMLGRLLSLVDEDTAAFNRIMEALGMPKETDQEKAARAAALEAATLYATQVPLKTMKAASEVFPLVKAMTLEGNPNSVSDAGVGALAARSAVLGAWLNVKINAASLKDRAAAEALLSEAEGLAAKAQEEEKEILDIIHAKLS